MALNFFKQRDIDQMDPDNIPADFRNYFSSLDDGAKFTIIETRPDLAIALGFDIEKFAGVNEAKLEENIARRSMDIIGDACKGSNVEDDLDIASQEINAGEKDDAEADADLEHISDNYYKDVAILDALHDNMEYLEALTMPDKTEKCFVHKTRLIKKQIRYLDSQKRVFSICVWVCEKCNRAFLEESNVEANHHQLLRRKRKHKIYDLDLSTRYLMRQLEIYELSEEDKLYVPEAWIEERPQCPIHNTDLFSMPCRRTYKDRVVDSTGFYCDECKKIFVQRCL